MKIVMVILGTLLLVSNAYWFFRLSDLNVTLSYRDQETYELEKTKKQLMEVVADIAKNATKDEIVAAARKHTYQQIYEEDGCTWIGWLGFKFDGTGKLQSVSPAMESDDADPCYPTF